MVGSGLSSEVLSQGKDHIVFKDPITSFYYIDVRSLFRLNSSLANHIVPARLLLQLQSR